MAEVTSFKPCDYCWRGAKVEILLAQGAVRTLLGLQRRRRWVCLDHVTAGKRPGAWRA